MLEERERHHEPALAVDDRVAPIADRRDEGEEAALLLRLAAERDSIAREYATAFAITFDLAAPALERARTGGLAWDAAVVETFLIVLAAHPDTHIARRAGAELASAVSARARGVLNAGGVRTRDGREALQEMDSALRAGHNTASPGTTADLTAAAIFVVLLAGGWGTDEGGRHAATR